MPETGEPLSVVSVVPRWAKWAGGAALALGLAFVGAPHAPDISDLLHRSPVCAIDPGNPVQATLSTLNSDKDRILPPNAACRPHLDVIADRLAARARAEGRESFSLPLVVQKSHRAP